MTDDIVTRLRTLHKYSDIIEACEEAADEIERLRLAYEKAVLLRQLEHTHFCSNDIHGKCLHWAEDQLEQALRND